MLKKLSSIWAVALCIFLAVFLPYYVSKSGYYHIGTDKYYFFLYGMLPFVITFIFLSVYNLFNKKPLSLSRTDIFVLAFSVCCLLSHFTSINKEISLWGQNEWHLGLITQLLFVVIYFGISRYFLTFSYFFHFVEIINIPLSILTICNRFGFYPIRISGQHPLYVSTIGNINWYCGYFIMIVGLELALYFYSNNLRDRIIHGFCLFVSLLSLICQGSMSGYVALLFLLLVLLYPALTKKSFFLRYLEIYLFLFFGCSLMYISNYFIPDAYVEYDEIIHLIAFSILPLICLFITALFYIVILYCTDRLNLCFLYKYVILFCIVGLCCYFVLCSVNTFYPHLAPALNNNTYFTFNRFYFSTRGGTYAIGVEAFFSLPWYQRFFGVGPDCFLSYVYSHLDMVKTAQYFQIQPLANAHNEFLTMFVNTGILGGIAYLGIFISSIRSIYQNRQNKYAKLLLFGILGYMINNFFSFQQVISTPFVFLLLGILENLTRRENTNVTY